MLLISPVTKNTITTYITVGTASYCENYLHLWEAGNPEQYLTSSYTQDVVLKSLLNENEKLYIIRWNSEPVGILKLILDQQTTSYTATDALYLQKLYILKSALGKGIGSKTIQWAIHFAKTHAKKVIWLETMAKGKALDFYLKNEFSIVGDTAVSFNKVKPTEKAMFLMHHVI